MPFENQKVLHDAATSHAEFESLVARVVELTLARVNGPNLKPFLNSRECAELIGVTPEHLCAMRARSDGPPWSGAGKWVRYNRQAVLNWLANLPQQPSASAYDRLLAATRE
jgi:hypothetical protein